MAKTRKPPPPPSPPAPVETPSPQRRRKKKGRPSLLDLQRRSLRLQAQNPSPADSPARRDPNPSDDDDDDGSGRRRQKRLKSVLAGGVKEERGEGMKDATKATGKGDAASAGGPTGTPLPDKKLLLFILDRLQKKDTYGVFSEPVDPEELPDYHEIIEHPMDFSTIREKLLNDSYSILEEFENDVFLLTSNAMAYNSADTVYHRQARSIEALAKKDFENLRQPSDEEDEPPKPPARRGRPPKNPRIDDDVSPDLSNAKTIKSEDNAETIRKRLTGDRTRNTNTPMKDSSTFHSMLGSFSARRPDKIGEYSGSSKWGKKPTISDDERRSTYDQHYSRSTLFSVFDDEKKILLPVGIQQQHAYARSLARFAAKMGPVAWDLAANRIRRTLPPGTNFGPGWVVDGEQPENLQGPPAATSTTPSSQLTALPSDMTSKNVVLHHKPGLSSNGNVTGEEQSRTETVASTSLGLDKSSEIANKIKYENGVNKSFGGMDNNNTGPAPSLQHHGQGGDLHSNINGFTAAPNTINQFIGQGMFGSGVPMTHAQVLGMFSAINGRTNGYIHGHAVTADRLKPTQNGEVGKAAANPVHDVGHDRKVAMPLNDNVSAPSLNGVQSSDSPLMGKVANPKQPDLALQL
ncbi:hypothetical protein PR202_ga27186 [Eleusine coracana subsp. coracana]|uniref:Bromo domain-containing protein n=1 Tax=Eleusine coracana subsp. coracana TaxID=191504 RepID=A0AAV5DG40_ELECO|nr:hypothetical protein PR202_ga27186 [Eleusine coracana subsp. coracana]